MNPRLYPAGLPNNPAERPLIDSNGQTVDSQWVMAEPMIWKLMDDDFTLMDDQWVEVPAGASTDLASVPSILQMLPGFSQNGKSRRPAIVHDQFYRTRKLRPNDPNSPVVDREFADEFLRQAMILEGANPIVARMFWLGVRAMGWRYFGKD